MNDKGMTALRKHAENRIAEIRAELEGVSRDLGSWHIKTAQTRLDAVRGDLKSMSKLFRPDFDGLHR
jgi:hypothetical protein